MAKLIMVADLGRIRTLHIRKKGADPRERDHLVQESDMSLEENQASRGEVVTDQSGRFARGAQAGSQGGMSYGEQHNLSTEMERKAIEHLASKIDGIVAEHGHPSWILAVPQSILARLQAALPAATRDRLSHSIGADLTKIPLAKLEERFVG
jgi:hypothetical protein